MKPQGIHGRLPRGWKVKNDSADSPRWEPDFDPDSAPLVSGSVEWSKPGPDERGGAYYWAVQVEALEGGYGEDGQSRTLQAAVMQVERRALRAWRAIVHEARQAERVVARRVARLEKDGKMKVRK